MLADLAVAPLQPLVQRAPVRAGFLDHQAGQAAELVAGVIQHLGSRRALGLAALGEHQPKLGQHAADSVDAAGALLLVALAQTVRAQHRLLATPFPGT